MIDFDGDARDDLVYVSSTTSGSGTWRIRKANASGGFDSEINTGITNTNYASALPLEWDGDGRIDLLVPYSSNRWWVLRSNGSGFDSPWDTGLTAAGAGDHARAYDINGDGRDDLVRVSSSGAATVWVRYRESSNFGSEQQLWTSGDPNFRFYNDGWSPLSPVDYRYRTARRRADFDGDGREDFIGWLSFYDMETQTSTLHAARFYAGSPGVAIDGDVEVGGNYMLGDLNDDQLTDVVWIKNAGGLRILYGGSNTPVAGPGTSSHHSLSYVIADYDGDGRDDIVMQRSSNNIVEYFRSEGSALAAPVASSISYPLATPLRTGDVNGDGFPDLVALTNPIGYNLHQPTTPDLLASATDGYGVAASFTYAPMTDASVYTKGSGATFPDADLTLARQIVKQATFTDGTGGNSTYTLTFTYQGARRNLAGRGFLGFAGRTIVDSRLGYNLKTEESYLQSWPHTGLLSGATLKQSTGTVIRQISNSWNEISYGSGARKYPFLWSSSTQLREAGGASNGTHYATIATTLAGASGVDGIDSVSGLVVDATSTVTEIATGLNAGQSKSMRVHHSLVLNDTTNWCIGRPRTTLQINSHSLTGGGSKTREAQTTWSGVPCRPTQQVIEPNQAAWTVTSALGYDSFGNVSGVAVTGASMSARTTLFGWGSAGTFPESITNALSKTTSQGFRYDLGLQTSITDPNGLQTSWQYDDFGRKSAETRPDDTKTTWTVLACSGCDARVKYFVTEQLRTNANTSIRTNQLYLDRFDRLLYDYQQLANGSYSIANLEFDARGRMTRRYNPHWSSSEGYWQIDYDLMDRPTSEKLYTAGAVLDRQRGYTYGGLALAATDAESHQSTRYSTAWGDLARVVDAASGNTNYQFDSFGLPTQVSDANGNVTSSIGYNVRGMKNSMTDADLGAWTYVPNALGEVTHARDPRTTAPAWTTIMGYDALGRMTTRQDVAEAVTSTFAFGTTQSPTSKTIGRLVSLTTSNSSYTELLTYDGKGRLATDTITTDASYEYQYEYDAQTGLPSTMTYPASTSSYRFKLRYDYAYGYLSKVKRFDSPYTEYWKFNTIDARGNVLNEDLGNGLKVASGFSALTGMIESRQSGPGGGTSIQNLSYQWSPNGNLTQRNDLRQSMSEVFTYDTRDRLDVSTLNGSGNLDVDYNAIGNITKKTDVSASTWTYDATRKHAVTAAGSNTFGYDPNGNASTRNGSSVTWFSYNLPNLISGSGVSSQFTYDPQRQRVKQIANYTGGVTETTHYIGGLMEKVVTASNTQYKHYIAAPTGLVGVYTRRASGSPLEDTYYFTKDHLGSIDSITNAGGTVQVRLSYDAFGKRRNASGWSGSVPAGDLTAIANTTRRGYTQHEHLDNLGLIHMNGRVQDPTIGRFLSADPFVPNPLSGQSLNRYSYVENNPLSWIDPSGFMPDTMDSPDVPPPGPAWPAPWCAMCDVFNFFGWATGSRSFPHASPEGEIDPRREGMDWGTPVETNPFTGFAEPGSSGAIAGYALYTDPDVSEDAKINIAAVALVTMTGGTALSIVPEAWPIFVLASDINALGDGGPVNLRFPARLRSVGAAQVWSTKARLHAAQLPTSGRIRYVPPEGYHSSMPLPRGPNKGYVDRFGNEWVPDPSRTGGQAFEWDIQLSRTGRHKIGWLSRDGKHVNVSLDGEVTH